MCSCRKVIDMCAVLLGWLSGCIALFKRCKIYLTQQVVSAFTKMQGYISKPLRAGAGSAAPPASACKAVHRGMISLCNLQFCCTVLMLS